jgi:hypothetical protein
VQRPISQLRTSDLTLQHAKLVAQQQDLDLFLSLRATPEHDQLEQPPGDQYANERTMLRERPATA